MTHLSEPTEQTARGPPKWYQLTLAREHIAANQRVYGEYEDRLVLPPEIRSWMVTHFW